MYWASGDHWNADIVRTSLANRPYPDVIGSSMVESVYCNFYKFPDDAGFQRWIGYADLKSAPIYFYVTRYSSFSRLNTPIAFELARLNEGNALDLQGYSRHLGREFFFFSFAAQTFIPLTSAGAYYQLGLYLNGNFIGSGWTDLVNTPVDSQLRPVGFHATFHMKAGDQV
ncbi:hypothetical protein OUZ56_019575 [Daphnia magna]|uniref:Uncharacterized protein n=1 Tax=Daphnia magna TaxID=35525 RepID=A0ABQ9ZBZ1_9CRUS|nr:hypothetical protein OUZ56_019575 [Daphnia magna]